MKTTRRRTFKLADIAIVGSVVVHGMNATYIEKRGNRSVRTWCSRYLEP